MATLDGAKCLPGGDTIGAIAHGMKADIAFIDTRAEHMCPEHDVISNIVYAASAADVDTVFVDGKPVMQGRRMLYVDEQEVKRQCAERAARLVGRSKV